MGREKTKKRIDRIYWIFGIMIIIIVILFFVFIMFSSSYVLNKIAKSELNTEEIWECEYKNQIVYYVIPGCCDLMTSLYTQNGERICHPSGGKPGVSGDGKCPDFDSNYLELKASCKTVWRK